MFQHQQHNLLWHDMKEGKALNDIDGVKDDLYAFKQAANEIVVEKNPLLNGKAAIINLGVEAIKK